MTELRFPNLFITYTQGIDEPFEIVVTDECYGTQPLSSTEAKEIADFIYEILGLTLHKPLIVNLSDISEDQMKEISKQINDNGKNLATITLSK